MVGRVSTAAAAALAFVSSAFAAAPIPTPIGVGPRFHPGARSTAVIAARPVGRLRCAGTAVVQRAHLELFAQGRVVIVPAGIGISRARACAYPVRTTTPTGVVEFDPSKRLRLGDFFAVWNRRLAPGSMLTFSGKVRAYVDGKRRHGDVRAIPLRRHAEIVLEVGRYIPPHAAFLFGPGR
jgi:hypothetical protein